MFPMSLHSHQHLPEREEVATRALVRRRVDWRVLTDQVLQNVALSTKLLTNQPFRGSNLTPLQI